MGKEQTKDTFTTIICRSKKYVPGVGSYTPNMNFVTVSNGRKRL
jgi:hypothetical protein